MQIFLARHEVVEIQIKAPARHCTNGTVSVISQALVVDSKLCRASA
jgi:hypothetical protein